MDPGTIQIADPVRAESGEWLLTNGIGGFAMGSAAGINRRRYHGLLVAAARPPVGRILALHSLIDHLVIGEQTIALTAHEFDTDPQRHPADALLPARFQGTPPGEARCLWKTGRIEIARTLTLSRGRNLATVEYELTGPAKTAALRARPLTPMRDFHDLESSRNPPPEVELSDAKTLLVMRGDLTLRVTASRGKWDDDGQWWYDFAYTEDRDRGQSWHEDIYSPAVLEAKFPRSASGSRRLTLQVELVEPKIQLRVPPLQTDEGTTDDASLRLSLASDQFIVRRHVDDEWCASILAGYPWFADWGRDTMIALPGLLLCTGRVQEARTALLAFARHVQRGLIPNCFDDYGTAAHYNSVDAALWFVHAVHAYHETAAGKGMGILLEACRQIVESYRHGTDFGIRMDEEDGLIIAGDESTQLTWMDAKRDNIAFTPRFGKPVEINALWHNALLALAKMTRQPAEQNDLLRLAEQVADAFSTQFWWPARSCLHDVIAPGEGGFVGDSRLRPNQIFAVSLPHSPLSPQQQKSVVEAVREHLLTPFGLRTLEPGDPQYRPRYEGDMFQRDSAYHQGTVWPWLIGPYCEAVLRVGEFSDAAKDEVRQTLQPLVSELDRGCVGQIAEVYDGDPPHRPSGCPAQAWSVAEVLRVIKLLGD
ncbi:MAG: glycogen debranching enzyme family protein [Phycisphaerales bacterium]|nr:MAG: glycogen debranching enzyme family protein [Phycisphaerales bacterium]